MGLMRPPSKKKVISRMALASRSRINSNTAVGNGISRTEAAEVVACVNWDNLDSEALDGLRPWEQLANEPEDSFEWFTKYLDMGYDRTLSRLTEELFPNRTRESTRKSKYHISPLLSEARRDFDWDRRCAAFAGYTARRSMKRLEIDKIRQQTQFHRLAAELTEDVAVAISGDESDHRNKTLERLAEVSSLIVGKDQGYGKLVVELNKALNGEKQLIDARVASTFVPWNP